MIFYLGVITFLLLQCKFTPRIKELSSSNWIYIPKENGMFFRPLLLKSQGDTTLTFTNNTSTGVYSFNLKTSNLKFIYVRFKPHYTYINQYHFINDSTLLVSFNEAYLGEQHDSIVLLYNINTNKKIPYKFDSLNVVLSNNNKKYLESDYLFPMYCPFVLYPDSSLITTGSNSKSVIKGDIKLFKLYPKNSTKFSKSISLPFQYEYPKDSLNFYFHPHERHLRGCVGESGKIIFSYGITNNLMITDRDLTKIEYKNSHPSFLPKARGEYTAPKVYRNLENIEFEDLYYFAKGNFYIRLVRMPSSKNNPLSYSYPEYQIIRMNESFEIQKIYKLPFGIAPPIIPYKDGLLAFYQYRSDKSDSFCFQVLDFNSKKQNTSVKPKTYNAIGWNEYLQSIDSRLSKYNKVVLIPVENMCTECIQSMNQFIQSLDTNTTAVVLIASSERNINSFVNKHKINSGSFFRDYTGLYKRLGIDMFNFNLLTKTNQDQYTWKRYSNAEIPDLFKILK